MVKGLGCAEGRRRLESLLGKSHFARLVTALRGVIQVHGEEEDAASTGDEGDEEEDDEGEDAEAGAAGEAGVDAEDPEAADQE